MKCKICGNESNNQIYVVKERFLNKGEKFRYLLCNRCQTLQLIDAIENIGEYYSNYRVFKNKYKNENSGKKFLDKVVWKIKMKLYLEFPLGEGTREKWNEYLFLQALRGIRVRKHDRILDVGCGSGRWLDQLAEAGFRNLYGIDKYADNISSPVWEFIKGDLSVARKIKYDLITFHHSFEHMSEPYAVLRNVRALLKEKGICIIRIPVFGKRAWKLYGTDWYQIDAPRHYFIY